MTVHVRVQDMDLAALNGRRVGPSSTCPIRWTLRCAALDGTPHPDASTSTVQPRIPRGAKRPRTQSFMGALAAPDWWSWAPKWGGGWSDDSADFSAICPKPGREGSLRSGAFHSCLVGLVTQMVFHLGMHCGRVSRCRCWSVGEVSVRTGPRQPPLK